MSSRTSVICDECGAEKRETNHWFVSYIKVKQIVFVPALNTIGNGKTRRDYCGQSCVSSAFQRWLDTGSILKEVQEGRDV